MKCGISRFHSLKQNSEEESSEFRGYRKYIAISTEGIVISIFREQKLL